MAIEFTHTVIDIAANEAAGRPLTDVVGKLPGDLWLVSAGPIHLNGPLSLREVSRGNLVPIPLIPYLTHPDPVLAMAFVMQLGLRCAGELPGKVKRVHIAIGTPLNTVIDSNTGSESIQCYLGFGVVPYR